MPIPISAPPFHHQPDSLCNPFSAPFPHPDPDPNHYSNQNLNLTPTPPRKTFSLNPLQASSTTTLNPTPNYIPTLSPTANSHLPMFTGNTNSPLIQVPTRVSFLRSTSTSSLTLPPNTHLSPAQPAPNSPCNPTAALLPHPDSKHYIDLHPNLSIKPYSSPDATRQLNPSLSPASTLFFPLPFILSATSC